MRWWTILPAPTRWSSTPARSSRRPPRKAWRQSSTSQASRTWRAGGRPSWSPAACRPATAPTWKRSFPRRARSCRAPARTTWQPCSRACSRNCPHAMRHRRPARGTDAAGDESGEGASAQADAGTGSEGLAGAAGVQQAEAEAVSAYVKISDGCDRFCSYCTIPFIRGRYRSFPLGGRVRRGGRARGARRAGDRADRSGHGALGRRLRRAIELAALVTALAERHPRTWFRVMYVQPEGVDDALLDAVASHPNVCPYFDLPLQHVDASLLAAMNRKGSREDFLALAERIRTRVPHAVLRTTLIAGFPGETEEQFEDLCDFVEEAPFDYVGVFAYLPRRGHPRLRASRPAGRGREGRPRAAPARRGRRLLHAAHRRARWPGDGRAGGGARRGRSAVRTRACARHPRWTAWCIWMRARWAGRARAHRGHASVRDGR